MRLNRGSELSDAIQPHAGALLLAHPSLRDPNFRRSVILLSAYSLEEGSIGVIVNRPMKQSLGEYDPELSKCALADVPLFAGGPVASDQLILVAWKWSPDEGAFKLYFGIDDVKAERILAEDRAFELRGFLGHAGWTGGSSMPSWIKMPG